MTFIEFLWLAHFCLIGLYLLTIGYYIRSRYFKDKETWESIYDVNRDPHDNQENLDAAGRLIGLGLGGHAFVFGISQDVFPFALIVLIFAFAFCAKRLADVEPVFSEIEHRKRLERRHGKRQGKSTFGGAAVDDDDYFSYKEASGGSTRDRSSREHEKQAPYGWE